MPRLSNQEQKTLMYARIDDMDLAHDMALAMDPHMELLTEQEKLLLTLQEDPNATFIRAGKKAVIFSQLIYHQMREDIGKGVYSRAYKRESVVEGYVHHLVGKYLNETVDSKIGSPWGNQFTANFVPNSMIKITNGFVASLQQKAINRTQEKAHTASALIYFKQKERENIAVYESVLSEKDMETYSPKELELMPSDETYLFEGDEDTAQLDIRSSVLWETYRRKRAVHVIAAAFGRIHLDDLSRSNFENMCYVLSEEYHNLDLDDRYY